ncbi:hypothetical protein OS242_14675 [Tumebacillus sp. DT12]|uniref:Zinc-finger domain-containing protein n=1 Tax=Tumebacillus lacus TaxID=2995335 RepID=A0ABT3X2Q6_9BACL|nr:hypothetical protein [Tumebacillus lacus]MCX7571194.1 hypothetical protein [Tumebacillus lacus]
MNNCRERVQAIWAGLRSEEIETHLQTCAECADAWREKELLIQKLSALEVPPPSRSLLPSQEVIQAAVRRNRRRPWQKMSTAAAAAVLVLGVTTGLMIQQNNENPTVPGDGVPQQTVTPPPVTEVPPEQQIEPQKPTPDAETDPVTVELAAGVDAVPNMAQIKLYLENNLPGDLITKMTITGFVENQGSTKERSIGDLIYSLEMKPEGFSPVFAKGEQRSLIVLEPLKGQWQVTHFEPLAQPATAEQAARMWVEALYTRNGVLMYMAMAPESKAEKRSMFERTSWRVPSEDPRAAEGVQPKRDPSTQPGGMQAFTFPLVANDPKITGLVGTVRVATDGNGHYFVQSFGYGVEQSQEEVDRFNRSLDVSVDYVKEMLRDTVTKDAIEFKLGKEYVVEKHAVSGTVVSRYDFPGEVAYKYVKSPSEEGIATFDSQGLASGKMRMQVLIGFDASGKVRHYQVFYHDSAEASGYSTYERREEGGLYLNDKPVQ